MTLQISFHAFAATACSLGIQFAAVHVEVGVAANTRCCLGIASVGECLVSFPCAVTCSDNGRASAIDDDIGITIDGLSAVGRYFYIDDTAIDIHIVASLDTVILRRVDVEIHTLVDDDVGLAVDTVLIGAIYLQSTVAANEQFSFAVDGRLVVGHGSVFYFVGAVHYEVGIALTLDVDGCRRGTGDVRPVEVQFKVGIAINNK